nr:hypothetical protein [Kutzneria chonburiensis]
MAMREFLYLDARLVDQFLAQAEGESTTKNAKSHYTAGTAVSPPEQVRALSAQTSKEIEQEATRRKGF